MQACDFIDGKIFVVYGLGNLTIPNGYIIMNTFGDIIGEYKIGTLTGTEPEGIFVDRSNYEVLISDIDRKVYKITNK